MIFSYLLFYLLAGIGSLFISWMCTKFIPKSRLPTITKWLGIGAVVYGIGIIVSAVVSYHNYAEFIDLSYYHSFLGQLAIGQIPRIWDTGVYVWSQHFSPFLFLLVPAYWFGVSQGFLVFAQATLAVSAIVPLYFFTTKITKSPFLGVIMCWSYLLFGGIQSSVYYGFHEVTFFPFMLFLVLWAWSIRKYRLFVLCVILMLFIKEEIASIGICLGIYLLMNKSWKYGITAIGLAGVWGIISFGTISYFHHGGYEYWGQFLGRSILIGIEERKPLMLIETFGSYGFLPLLWLPNYILMLPVLAMKLLSSDITMMNSFHYSSTYTGLLVVSCVFTIVFIVRKHYRTFIGWFLLCMACCGSFYYGYGYYYAQFPRMTLQNIRVENFMVGSRSYEREIAIGMIPSVASVGCQYQICTHIDRPYGKLYPIPGPIVPEYLIIDTSLPVPLKTNEEIRKFFTSVAFRTYQVVYKNGSIVVLKRDLSLQ